MQRRGLILGAAAAGLTLAKPAILRAREWNALPGRHPGQFWQPRMKPRPFQAVFDPQGKLSAGMVSIFLMAEYVSQLSGSGNILSRESDYVAAGNSMGVTGLTGTATPTPYGGMAVNTSGTSTSDFYGNLITQPSLLPWTFSALCKFDGIGAATYTGELVLFCNAGVTVFLAINGGTNLFSSNQGGDWAGSTAVTSLLSWHRITVVMTATSQTLYIDGIVNGTPNSATGVALALAIFVFGWPWPTADVFLWGRALSATDVLAHYQDPYGTTLRPKFAELGLKGTGAIGKKPSLLTTGVGP